MRLPSLGFGIFGLLAAGFDQRRGGVGSFRSARIRDNAKCDMASISDNKKSRGRPVTTGTGQMIGVRLQPDQLADVDAWAAVQEDKPSRPEAIRRLVAWGLRTTVLK